MRFVLRAILLLVLLAVVLALPSFASTYYLSLVIKIMIYALFALSLQLLVGCTGLVSLGHSAFFGIAAYFVTLLSPERSEERRVGKSVSVRVDLGGRRIIKKKKKSII